MTFQCHLEYFPYHNDLQASDQDLMLKMWKALSKEHLSRDIDCMPNPQSKNFEAVFDPTRLTSFRGESSSDDGEVPGSLDPG